MHHRHWREVENHNCSVAFGRPLTQQEQEVMVRFGQEMETEVIPQIVEAVKRRERLAEHARRRIL